MKKHEATHVLGRLYMNDIVSIGELQRLTARLEDQKTRDQAIETIKEKAKKLPQ